MLTQALHTQNNIIGAALHGLSARMDVINNNIANNDVPGFRARAVDFEHSLAQALERWGQGRPGDLDLGSAQPTLRFQNADTHFRMDRNNVDVEREMVQLFIASTKYEAMVNAVLNNSRRLNAAITGR